MSNSIYYSSDELFSHQSLYYFVMGERGNGKSFNAKSRMIKNFIKKGEQSVYVRRRETDMDSMKATFFNDVAPFFPDHDFEVKGNTGIIDGKEAIHMIPLSTSYKRKSSSFPLVTLIVFDEYVEPRDKFPNYFRDDMQKLKDLEETVFRDREKTATMLIGNVISYVNPFFTEYGIEIKDPSKRFHKYAFDEVSGNYDITVELTKSVNYREHKKATRRGRHMIKSEYGQYAIEGKVLEDNAEFIKPDRKGQHIFICSLYSQNQEVGIWFDENTDIYVDDKVDTSSKFKYYLLTDDMKTGYLNIKEFRSSWRGKQIALAFREGRMFFKNQEIKKFIQNNIGYIN